MIKATLCAAVVLTLSASGAIAQQMSPAAQAVLAACKPDIARFCGQVPPG